LSLEITRISSNNKTGERGLNLESSREGKGEGKTAEKCREELYFIAGEKAERRMAGLLAVAMA